MMKEVTVDGKQVVAKRDAVISRAIMLAMPDNVTEKDNVVISIQVVPKPQS